jgi:sigma-B regulation protein RsbU (phosphoserine phosphatase)
MATAPVTVINSEAIPAKIDNSCNFVQSLMKLQRAAQLITSTFDLDHVLERVVNDLVSCI